MPTDKPFDLALSELLEERELSIRGLAKRTRERHPAPEGEWSRLAAVRLNEQRDKQGLGHPYIAIMVRGDQPPSSRAIEIVADALLVEPEHFPEYRLDVAKERLEWRALDRDARHRRLRLALRTLEAGT